MQAKVVQSAESERLNVLGVDTRVLLNGTDTGQGLTLLELVLPPSAEVPRHVHEREDETFHVLAGALDVAIDGRLIQVAAGTTIYAPRGLPHAIRAGQDGANVLVVACPAGIESMFGELGRLPAGQPVLNKVAEICARYGVSFV